MTRGCIVGWAHTPFGKLEDPDVESLMARVSGEALAHAGVGPQDVDGIYVGVMNNGFSKQGFEIGGSLHSARLCREWPRTCRSGRRR
jgi:acetyl-CoA C-acetyltransferase